MAGDSSSALQTAIYTKLTSDSTLDGLVTGVFDSVPETTDYPYISIGADTFIDWGAMDFQGMEATITIHSWSRARGRKEVKAIMARIYALLHEASLTVTSHNCVLIRQEYSETLLDPDGTTYHGVQRFRALTHES